MEFLTPYNVKINYIKGKENTKINALNKKPDYNTKILKNLQAVF